MLQQLRQTCRQLLQEGTVQVVIGYGQATQAVSPYPVFVTSPDDVGQLVWNERCRANLAKYLLRKEIRALGKPALVVKGCDERALVVLEQESQLDRSQIVVIGMACPGMDEPRCAACDAHQPRFANVMIGEVANEGLPAQRRYAALHAFMERSAAERMAYWTTELARCVKCYACRQACPLCYCERCIVDKNRPTSLDTSATLKGNFAWHITRAFHLAGRCVGCEQCTRVCPAGIDLRLLNLAMAQAAEESFAFRAGTDPQAAPILGSYSQQDQETFIR
ncbi:MAG: 4Fe-4S dicluster domain-containing protein [Planctomycetota bacterium]|nr:4Fe-4S dicluster domain-containing protein [Planctomycetota bacterium]